METVTREMLDAASEVHWHGGKLADAAVREIYLAMKALDPQLSGIREAAASLKTLVDWIADEGGILPSIPEERDITRSSRPLCTECLGPQSGEEQ